MPALAFFVPEGYALQGDTFTVKLSDSLVQLFGTDDIISVYDARTRITYILPSSIRQFFVPAEAVAPAQNVAPAEPEAPAEPSWIDVPSDALAYVYATAIDRGGIKYCYLIGLDVTDMLQKDDKGKSIRNTEGKYVLVREGDALETLKNTIIHEMFHAFMDDYNRTGMMGGTKLADVITNDENEFPTEELEKRYRRIIFPKWFIEGSASSVENVYQYRFDDFKQMREKTLGGGQYNDWFDKTTFLANYVNGKSNGKPLYADLYYCDGVDEDGNEISNTQSAYVMGYVAILYLSELKARATTGSAIWTDGKQISISNDKLRTALDGILKDLHKGATLDQVIYDISPVASDGSKVYKDTAAFQELFIKGPVNKNDEYPGDDGSLAFAIDFLNHLQVLSVEPGKNNVANGSILFDFGEDYTTPLDENKDASSDYYQIIESNELEESSVPSDVALQGGGKSDPDVPQEGEDDEDSTEQQQAAKTEATDEQTASEDLAALPLAAKPSNEPSNEADASASEVVADDVEVDFDSTTIESMPKADKTYEEMQADIGEKYAAFFGEEN